MKTINTDDVVEELPIDEPLPYIDMSTWDDVRAPLRHWLVYDRIPRRQPTLLSGHGEAGKSTLLLQLLCSTVLNRDWIGFMPEPGPAIYVGAEEEADELHRRLDPILAHYGARYADLIANGFKLLSYAGEDMVLGIIDKQGRVEPTDLYHRLYRDACALKPKLVAIDGLSDTYVGNERERGQVRQFMGLFRRLGIHADCAPVISAHPSLEGIRSGSGISGTTQWFNSIRAQMYLKSPDEDDENTGDQSDLRELQFLKNQYGRKGTAIRLQWKNGLYLPVSSPGTLDALAAEQKVDNLFLALLRRFTKQDRNVSDKTGTTYAPAQFAKEPEAKSAKATANALADAMRRLFAADKIHNEIEGPPSRRRSKIVDGPAPSTDLSDPSTAPKSRHTENKSTRWKQEPTCAATTGTSSTSTDTSTDIPPSSTDLATPPPLYPPPGGACTSGGSRRPPLPGKRGKSDDLPYIGPMIDVPDQGADGLDEHGAPREENR